MSRVRSDRFTVARGYYPEIWRVRDGLDEKWRATIGTRLPRAKFRLGRMSRTKFGVKRAGWFAAPLALSHRPGWSRGGSFD